MFSAAVQRSSWLTHVVVYYLQPHLLQRAFLPPCEYDRRLTLHSKIHSVYKAYKVCGSLSWFLSSLSGSESTFLQPLRLASQPHISPVRQRLVYTVVLVRLYAAWRTRPLKNKKAPLFLNENLKEFNVPNAGPRSLLVPTDSLSTTGMQELEITTPKSPGGKLWSPTDYDTYNGVSKKPSSPSFKPGGSKPSSARRAQMTGA